MKQYFIKLDDNIKLNIISNDKDYLSICKVNNHLTVKEEKKNIDSSSIINVDLDLLKRLAMLKDNDK